VIAQIGLVAAPTIAFVAAESSSTGIDITSVVGTVVTPVVVIALLIMGKLRTENEIKNRDETITILRQQVREKDAQLESLQEGVVNKAIPALTRAALILEKVSPDSIIPVSRDR
jgi:hypothetical protein